MRRGKRLTFFNNELAVLADKFKHRVHYLPIFSGLQLHGPGEVAFFRIHDRQIRQPRAIHSHLSQGAEFGQLLEDLQWIKSALE